MGNVKCPYRLGWGLESAGKIDGRENTFIELDIELACLNQPLL